jgi:hypothetical protein
VTGFIDEYYDGEPGGAKVDPTPGGQNSLQETTIEDDYSQVIFTNRYWMSSGGGEENPAQAALTVTKGVAGNAAEKTRDFLFTVKVTQPEAITTGDQTYLARIVDAGGNDVTADNYATLNGDGYIEFTSGSALAGIKLKHGQKLEFVDLHVGSAVAVEEQAAADYIPKYQRTFAGTGAFSAPNKNTNWGFPRAQGDEGPHYTVTGANANTVTFTNTRVGATPTGIGVDDLPYIVLAGLALACAAGFVTFKARRRAKGNA